MRSPLVLGGFVRSRPDPSFVGQSVIYSNCQVLKVFISRREDMCCVYRVVQKPCAHGYHLPHYFKIRKHTSNDGPGAQFNEKSSVAGMM